MKSFGKIFVLCFFCSILAMIFVSCGPNIDASTLDKITQDEIIGNVTDVDTPNLPDDAGNQPSTPDDTDDHNKAESNIDDNQAQNQSKDTDNENQDKPEQPDINKPNDETNHEPEQKLCEHSNYSEWETIKEPTCTETGERVRKCLACGETQSEILDKAEHEYEDYTVEPTCAEDGYTVSKCKHCGYCDETTKVIRPATGHHNYVNHECEHCHAQQSPIENLAGSYWYSTKYNWAICFEESGNYHLYKNKSNDKSVFEKGEQINIFYGQYKIEELPAPDDNTTKNYIELYDITLPKNAECNYSDFHLFYSDTQKDNNDNPIFILDSNNTYNNEDGYLFIYQNCTLIFVGYEL